jgi:predicted Zn-dependent peptidase
MLKRIINIIVVFCLILSIGFAQGSKLDRSKAPQGKKAKAITFPKFKQATLSNGLELIVIENNVYPFVQIFFGVEAGNFYDGDKTGLSVLTSRLQIKGSDSRNAMQIAGDIDFLASTIYSGASWDVNYFAIRSLKKNLNQTLDILVDCILNPTFPEDELQREVTQIVANYKRGKTETNELSENEFMKVTFGEDNPYGKRITETNIKKITTDDIKDFYKKYFLPNNTFCVINGDITLKEAVTLLEQKLKDWKKGPLPPKDKGDLKIPPAQRVVVVNRDGAVQSSIRIGGVTMTRTNPDFLKLEVVNTYLGGYFQSQLMQKLREEKSYTYGVNSGIEPRLFAGVFGIRTQVGSQFTADAVTDILKEIKQLSTSTISDDRFNALKNYLIGNFSMSLESDDAIASRIRDLRTVGAPLNYYDNYIPSVQKMTKEDFLNVAKKYLDVSKMSIVISGDNEKIAPTLSKFGNVESVDADGNPIK